MVGTWFIWGKAKTDPQTKIGHNFASAKYLFLKVKCLVQRQTEHGAMLAVIFIMMKLFCWSYISNWKIRNNILIEKREERVFHNDSAWYVLRLTCWYWSTTWYLDRSSRSRRSVWVSLAGAGLYWSGLYLTRSANIKLEMSSLGEVVCTYWDNTATPLYHYLLWNKTSHFINQVPSLTNFSLAQRSFAQIYFGK